MLLPHTKLRQKWSQLLQKEQIEQVCICFSWHPFCHRPVNIAWCHSLLLATMEDKIHAFLFSKHRFFFFLKRGQGGKDVKERNSWIVWMSHDCDLSRCCNELSKHWNLSTFLPELLLQGCVERWPSCRSSSGGSKWERCVHTPSLCCLLLSLPTSLPVHPSWGEGVTCGPATLPFHLNNG